MRFLWKTFKCHRKRLTHLAICCIVGLVVLVTSLFIVHEELSEWRDTVSYVQVSSRLATKPHGPDPSSAKWQNTRRSFCPPLEVLTSSEVNTFGKYPPDKRFLSIGISTVHRPGGGYLVQTIQSLLDNSDEISRKNTYLVVYLADLKVTYKAHTAKTIAKHFRKNIEEGFLHVIQADRSFYPRLDDLKSKYGDSKQRTKWRSKQNVDYGFLMCYCANISKFYLHLEDDVTASPKFMYKLRDFISEKNESEVVIEASIRGHVGKVYHSRDLGNVASYLLLMYDEMPVDFLIPCWIVIHGGRKILPAALFKHIGFTSSLSEKIVNTSDRYFDQYDHKYSGLNPEADVTSSFVPNVGEPPDAYKRGVGYFRSKYVNEGDFVQVRFRTATKVKQIFIGTGSDMASKDIIESADLEASFLQPSVKKNREKSCRNFEKLATFHEGLVDVSVVDEREISCIRLLVTAAQKRWIFLREIDVWPQL